MDRMLQRVRDDERDRLTLMVDPIVLKDVKPLADFAGPPCLYAAIGQARRIAMREHRNHARSRVRQPCCRLKRCDRWRPCCVRSRHARDSAR